MTGPMTTELSWIEQVHGDKWLCLEWKLADKSFADYRDLKQELRGAYMFAEYFGDACQEAEFLRSVLEEKFYSALLSWQTEEVTA